MKERFAMKFFRVLVSFGIFAMFSNMVFADTTNTIKQKGANNTIDNKIVGKGDVSTFMNSGSVSVGGTATQNSILVNDTKHGSTNTIDLNGGTNTISGTGMQNSIAVGKGK
ncbi:hypothetical protein [Paraburkholderia azotifigens]|uniref:hypothetical protein n=1 Tax=Paraburkholderia azotifigens TaxID=2057004 RepID=UPI00319E095A